MSPRAVVNKDSMDVSMMGNALNTSQTVDIGPKSSIKIANARNQSGITKNSSKPKSSRRQRYQIDEESASDPTYSQDDIDGPDSIGIEYEDDNHQSQIMYDLSTLKKGCPDKVNPKQKEDHLSNEDFIATFGMNRAAF